MIFQQIFNRFLHKAYENMNNQGKKGKKQKKI